MRCAFCLLLVLVVMPRFHLAWGSWAVQMSSGWFLTWFDPVRTESSQNAWTSQSFSLPQVSSQEESQRENGQEVAASPGSGE